MVIRIKKVNGKNYVYFIHYLQGKKVDVYCGAESKSESRKKALVLEIKEIKKQMNNLNEKMLELTTQYEKIVRADSTNKIK